MKLTRPSTPKPFNKPAKPAPVAQPAQQEEVNFQDVIQMLTNVTQQNKAFAEGLSILTQKVDQIVKAISEVMTNNKEFCESVIQEISAISEYINIPPEEEQTEEQPEAQEAEAQEAEEAEAQEEEGITAEDIMQMSRGDLIALIEENELPIKASDYRKVDDLRKALIQYLESDDDDGDTAAEDSAPEEEKGDEDDTEAESSDDSTEADTGADTEADSADAEPDTTGGNKVKKKPSEDSEDFNPLTEDFKGAYPPPGSEEDEDEEDW